MKNLIKLSLLLMILSGCSSPVFFRAFYGVPEQDIDIQFNSLNEAWRWIDENIAYVPDPPNGNKKTPEQTYRDKSGDCEDYALLLCYFGNQLGLDVRLVISKIDYRGTTLFHAINKINSDYIDPQYYKVYWNEAVLSSRLTVLHEYSYEEAYYTDDFN